MEVATMVKVAPLSISVSPRTYRKRNTLTLTWLRKPSAATLLSVTDHLTQHFKWCGGATFALAGQQKQQQRRQRRWNRTAAEKEEAGEEMGGVGQAVLAALKSGVPRPSNSRNSGESGGTDERRSEEGKMETTLSGSDVLLALQRSKEAGRGKGSKRRRRSGQRGGALQEDDEMDYYSNVRPLSINRDWGARLDEMEKRLQDLRQTRLN